MLYLIGTIGITIARNVPLNDRLAALRPDSAAFSHRCLCGVLQ